MTVSWKGAEHFLAQSLLIMNTFGETRSLAALGQGGGGGCICFFPMTQKAVASFVVHYQKSKYDHIKDIFEMHFRL